VDLDPIRLLAHIHGHAGWLAVAALVHPAILLRNRRRRAHLSVALASLLATVAAGIGFALYPAYSEILRTAIFLRAPRIGWLFERKEHLAFGAILLVWTGAAAYVGAERVTGDARDVLRTVAFRSFVVAATLAGIVAALGTTVATYRSF
jgi:hypothetical protein